jgi:hypothetical protein
MQTGCTEEHAGHFPSQVPNIPVSRRVGIYNLAGLPYTFVYLKGNFPWQKTISDESPLR